MARRSYLWIVIDVLGDMLETLAGGADFDWLMIDSVIIRTHQYAGARKLKGGGCQGAGRCAPRSMPPPRHSAFPCA
jgi:hypothetical protein